MLGVWKPGVRALSEMERGFGVGRDRGLSENGGAVGGVSKEVMKMK